MVNGAKGFRNTARVSEQVLKEKLQKNKRKAKMETGSRDPTLNLAALCSCSNRTIHPGDTIQAIGCVIQTQKDTEAQVASFWVDSASYSEIHAILTTMIEINNTSIIINPKIN